MKQCICLSSFPKILFKHKRILTEHKALWCNANSEVSRAKKRKTNVATTHCVFRLKRRLKQTFPVSNLREAFLL